MDTEIWNPRRYPWIALGAGRRKSIQSSGKMRLKSNFFAMKLDILAWKKSKNNGSGILMCFLLMSGQFQQEWWTVLVETTPSHGLRSSGLKIKPWVDVSPPGAFSCPSAFTQHAPISLNFGDPASITTGRSVWHHSLWVGSDQLLFFGN